MPEAKASAAGISDTTVQARTGKTWSQWLRILDRVGAKDMKHAEIAGYMIQEHGCSGWWSQMITVGYERLRGRRQKHETPAGFHIGVSRTLAVPIAMAYRSWTNGAVRRRWLPGTKLVIRKATQNRCLRINWTDPETNVEITFLAKGTGRCQVVVDHYKLAGQAAALRMKQFWGQALDRLKGVLLEG